MDSIREEVIRRAARIAALRADLRTEEEALDALLGGQQRAPAVAAPAEPPMAPPRPSARPTLFAASPTSIPSRMLMRMSGEPARVYSPDDFSDMSDNIQTIRSALLRLADKGSLVKVDRGRFRLAANAGASAKEASA